MVAAGLPAMAEDPRLATNPGRVKHQQEIDDALGRWTAKSSSTDIMAVLDEAAVPAGPIYAVDDMVGDAQYEARGMFEEVPVGGRPLKVPAICPKLSNEPGQTVWAGPELGQHTREVLAGELGRSESEIVSLIEAGAVGKC